MSDRRRFGALLAAGLLAALFATPAHAIFGFGIHGGKDLVSVDEKGFAREDFIASATKLGIENFPASQWTNAIGLDRKAVSNPWLLGAHFYIDALPIFDIEASADVAMQKYKVTYFAGTGSPANETAEATFGRIGAYATVKRNLIELPTMAFYLGGGLDYNLVTPVAGPDLLVTIYGTDNPTTAKPKIEDAIDRDGKMGYHAVVGFRVKPPIIPLAARIEGKYTNTGLGTMERPESIFSAYLGLSLDF